MSLKNTFQAENRSPFDVGRLGTLAQFTEAMNRDTEFFASGTARLVELLNGAAMALRSGEPEKLQSFFGSDTPRKFSDGYFLALVMTNLSSKHIQQALETASPEKRQKTLDEALIEMAASQREQAPLFLKTLINAGADVNAEDGKAAFVAAVNSLPLNGKMLFELGADFMRALKLAENDPSTRRISQNVITRLDHYKNQLADKSGKQAETVVIEDVKQRIAAVESKLEKLETRLSGKNPDNKPTSP